tara:strand:- start:325 stop:1215 length:891 start_codon:yes stop_codon:yes gene_type:complete
VRKIKFYIKIFVLKILSSNNLFLKLYLFYFKFTYNKRFRSEKYAHSVKSVIKKNLIPLCENELAKYKNISILDFGCGPDIFNSVFLYSKFKNKIKLDFTDKFEKLNFNIVNKSFQYFFKKNSKEEAEKFFRNNTYSKADIHNMFLDKFYNIIFTVYVIELFTIKELNKFFKNIKNKFNYCIIICDFSDIYFIDQWDKKDDLLKFNKLGYSETLFNFSNNEINFQNRLRFNDFYELFLKNGYEIVEAIRCDVLNKKLNDNYFDNKIYKNFKIHKKFKTYKYEDLFTPKGVFIIKNLN